MHSRFIVYVAMIIFAIGYMFHKHNWDTWSTLKDLIKVEDVFKKQHSEQTKKPTAVSKVEDLVSIPGAPVQQVTDFRRAKDQLKKIFNKPDLRRDIYCGCAYNEHWEIDLNSCGYKVRMNAERAKRVEWEHVVPAAFFGRSQSCWKTGGRKNCEKSGAAAFNNFEGDLHNLRPAVGEVNGDRSDRMYAKVVGNAATYGACNFKLGADATGLAAAEPVDATKGALARVWLYMADKHSFEIPEPYKSLYASWAKTYPVTDKERQINAAIKAVQGDDNTYITGQKVPQ